MNSLLGCDFSYVGCMFDLIDIFRVNELLILKFSKKTFFVRLVGFVLISAVLKI